MFKVVVSGWNPGFRKVSTTELLKAHGLRLAQAKATVDQILDGGEVQIPADSEIAAAELVTQLIKLGAKARLSSDEAAV